MYTLVVVLTLISGAGLKQIESIVVPGFDTNINARILASQQFALMSDGITISSLCLATPRVQHD